VLIALLLSIAILALAAAAVIFLPSALLVTRYEIAGNVSMSRAEVISAAQIHDKEYFFSLDSSRIESALEAEPRIVSAKAERLFPNGLKITIAERRPIVAALVTIGSRAAVVCIDKEGVVYAESSPEEASSMPVLSGIRFENFRPGIRLPRELAALMASLGEIRESEPALLSAISEIRVIVPASPVSSTETAPELLIYPLNQRIPVRAGASLDAPTLRSIILVLDVLGTKGIAASVKEIDFRTGTVVYRDKEGQTG
jgi:cell division protein FtsQ